MTNLIYCVAATWLGIVGMLSSLFILAIIGPHSKRRGVSLLYKTLIIAPINAVYPLLVCVFGQGINDVWDYVVNKPNPIVQIFYLFIMIGGYSAFIFTGFPLLDRNVAIHSIHRWTSLALSSACLVLFTGLSTSNPGFIRSQEIANSLLIVFPQNALSTSTYCRTCKSVKLGRSKHCRFCGFCCCKYDHHCIWVNNCIGLLNWRLFVVFLFANLGLCLYGSILIPRMILSEINRLKLRDAVYIVGQTRRKVTRSLLLEWVISHHTTLFALTIACFIFALLLTAFILYQFYLHFWVRKTTNEFVKPANVYGRSIAHQQSFFDALFQDLLPLQWIACSKRSLTHVQVPEPAGGKSKRKLGRRRSKDQ